MTDEKVKENILKFVWQMNGAETSDRLRQVAIEKRWLDEDGVPTPHGRRLVDSFEVLRSIERNLM